MMKPFAIYKHPSTSVYCTWLLSVTSHVNKGPMKSPLKPWYSVIQNSVVTRHLTLHPACDDHLLFGWIVAQPLSKTLHLPRKNRATWDDSATKMEDLTDLTIRWGCINWYLIQNMSKTNDRSWPEKNGCIAGICMVMNGDVIKQKLGLN